MEAKELRIGNYYNHNGEIRQVTPNVILEIWESPRKWCEPIPLTEEWLIKFGFERFIGWDGMIFWRLQDFTMDSFELMETLQGYELPSSKICYFVHQLQNCYFFHELTGEELQCE